MIWTREEFKKLSSKDTNGCFEFDDGVKRWFKNGTLHREGGPAVESVNGTKAWFKNGAIHRDGGPALIQADGTTFWYKDDNLHRLDGPAIECSNGTKEWHIDGVYHTKIEFNKKISQMKKSEEKIWTYSEFHKLPDKEKTGKFKFTDGTIIYYNNGRIHRSDGPAFEGGCTTEWLINGVHHRLDGPAIEFSDGRKEFYIEGKRCTKTEFNKKILKYNNFESWSCTNIRGEKKMNKDNGFMDMVKSDLENAAYRVAATQMNKAVKAGIIKILESKGLEGPKAAAAAEMLDTEIGSAIVALLLGYGLKYAPKISEDTRAIKLSEEFRVKGMETVGNEVVGSLMEHLLPEVMNVLASLPEAKANEKVRVLDKKETVDEESVERAKLSVVKGK